MSIYTQQSDEFVQDVLSTIHANIWNLEDERTFADRNVGPPVRI